jgi:hypothetical protein
MREALRTFHIAFTKSVKRETFVKRQKRENGLESPVHRLL